MLALTVAASRVKGLTVGVVGDTFSCAIYLSGGMNQLMSIAHDNRPYKCPYTEHGWHGHVSVARMCSVFKVKVDVFTRHSGGRFEPGLLELEAERLKEGHGGKEVGEMASSIVMPASFYVSTTHVPCNSRWHRHGFRNGLGL